MTNVQGLRWLHVSFVTVSTQLVLPCVPLSLADIPQLRRPQHLGISDSLALISQQHAVSLDARLHRLETVETLKDKRIPWKCLPKRTVQSKFGFHRIQIELELPENQHREGATAWDGRDFGKGVTVYCGI